MRVSAVTVILMFWLPVIAPRAVAAVIPVDYRFGAIPVPYQPFDYTAYPSSPGSISAITDGSNLTYTQVSGLDNAPQGNGSNVDTGTFYLFKFKIDPDAISFKISFTAKMEENPFQTYDFLVEALLLPSGTVSRSALFHPNANQLTTFGLEFFRDHNTSNDPNTSQVGLNSILAADGTLRLVLQGGSAAILDHPGKVTTELYDITASYTVPEPSVIMTLLPLLPWLIGRQRIPGSIEFELRQ